MKHYIGIIEHMYGYSIDCHRFLEVVFLTKDKGTHRVVHNMRLDTLSARIDSD